MVICIIQARMGSTRLPEKVLMPILCEPMLVRQIERVKHSQLIDRIVIATTTKKEDDSVAVIAKKIGVHCFRGNEHDVLDRLYLAAKDSHADVVVRLTGDCPLSDPKVIDETIGFFLNNLDDIDYTSKPVNYPEGLDVEVFSFSVLERAWKEAIKPSEREHVTPYIYHHPEIFKIKTYKKEGGNFSDMHWSVDTLEDLTFVRTIFEKIYPNNNNFSYEDVLKLLEENPKLLSINKGGTGYEGFIKSINEDTKFQKKREKYQKMIGFIPDVVVILSAGSVSENVKGVVTYRSTKVDEHDCFGILWGESRVIAGAELLKYFTETKVIATSMRLDEGPTHAEVIGRELEKLCIPKSRIILEEKSNNTFSQIIEFLKIIYKEKWQNILVITNEYHVPRVRVMYEHLEKFSALSIDMKNIINKIKHSCIQIKFIDAESILPMVDVRFVEIISNMKKTKEYLKRLVNEKKGLHMILNGTYDHQRIDKDKHAS